MRKIILEYLWLDGYMEKLTKNDDSPEVAQPNIRSKTKIIKLEDSEVFGKEHIPDWGADGSSTKQAEGRSSDITLKPAFFVRNPLQKIESYIVMCEVYDKDDKPHPSNTRSKLRELYDKNLEQEFRFGFEQEYVLWDKKTRAVLGWDSHMKSEQGEFYCGNGPENVSGRDIVEEHMYACMEADIEITGTNAEVMLGQWEYQVGGPDIDGLEATDQLWVSRWLLQRIAEKHGAIIDLRPKPKHGDWNGSGMHVNLSTKQMRKEGGYDHIIEACERLSKKHNEHIRDYGADNDQRLTGDHETCSIKEFKYGVSDRGASIRIPLGVEQKQKGYLEDRRPASNADPYMLAARLIETICETKEVAA